MKSVIGGTGLIGSKVGKNRRARAHAVRTTRACRRQTRTSAR
jgi:prephenate dehydrogenase